MKLEKPGDVSVKWGYWRNYEDPGNPVWHYVAKVEDEIAEEEDLGGEGTCPLVVGRFNPIPGMPYGRGPAWMLLPEIRTLNALRQMILDKMERVVDPATIYTRDGLLDLSEGIEAGMAYPAMPGTSEEIREIGHEGNLDYGLFTLEELRRIIRHGFYRREEQKGKTPPSATQFIGMEQEVIRRMGRPGSAIFNEFVREMLSRVEFLEVRDRGLPNQILAAGDVITVTPISPMVRAQAQDEVIQSQALMEMNWNFLGPEQAPMVIDGPTTMRNIKLRLGDELVRFRTQEEIAQIIQATQPAQ